MQSETNLMHSKWLLAFLGIAACSPGSAISGDNCFLHVGSDICIPEYLDVDITTRSQHGTTFAKIELLYSEETVLVDIFDEPKIAACERTDDGYRIVFGNSQLLISPHSFEQDYLKYAFFGISFSGGKGILDMCPLSEEPTPALPALIQP
tara:strand:- start:33 stop:482 length:450 start_codon:yes stop_codon:yes gene_type:complete